MGSPLAISPPSVLMDCAVDLGGAVGEQFLLIAVGAEPALGHVDDLGPGVGVLQLDDIDVFRCHTGLFEGGSGGVDGGRHILVHGGEGRIDLIGAVPPGPHLDRLEVHGLLAVPCAMSARHMTTAAAPSSGAQNMYWVRG